MLMNVTAAQKRLHILLEGDTDYPTSGEDFNLRLELFNDAVEEWKDQTDTRWRELYATDTSHTGDGSTTSFALPSDFVELNGAIVLYDTTNDIHTPIAVIPVSRASEYTDSTDLVAWIQESNLVFNVAPDDGAQIQINYYQEPAALTQGSDVLPMSKPRFVIYWALAQLAEQSADGARFNTNMQKATDLLNQMKVDNDSTGEGVPNQIQSVSEGFGV